MEALNNSLGNALNYLKSIKYSDVFDILIVAFLIYKAIMFARKNNSYNLFKGVIIFLLALWISDWMKLTMINYVLRKTVELGLIALLILFQPELRRLLERVGRNLTARREGSTPEREKAIAQTVLACRDMSESRTGALIIFERQVKLDEMMSTGTVVNADTTAELLKNMFFDKAPLHDGAVIIRDGRIAAAGCVLPLTKNLNLSKELGMRHRAGIGLSEQSDAIVVIVSEETGSISLAKDGLLKRHLSENTLNMMLHSELIREDEPEEGKELSILRFFKVKKNEDNKSTEKDS